ncbi:MAG: ribosome biogenesis GTPase Der [Mariprofundaceae bacterium]|nr:ribosome biogenesis GTPase Der [Mariprofundaceae bacterium]
MALSRLPVVAIVGRPNVGKSTLFNRLVGFRQAIVGDRPGVTVDRLEGQCQCGARQMVLVDTGGIGETPYGEMQQAIDAQVDAALDVADLVIFAVDSKTGVTPVDYEIAAMLRRSARALLLVVNKAENVSTAHDFYSLGLGDPLPVSAMHGEGVSHLKSTLEAALPDWTASDDDAQKPLACISVIGRPNVGKSTLINAWLGRERMVVSPIAGTTRDAIDSDIPWQGGIVRLIDTAGQRKHGRIADVIEFVARVKAVQAFRRADVAVLLLDGGEGIVEQDMRLMQLARESGCALMVVVNKCDLLSDAEWKYYAERLNFRMRGLPDIPVKRISAKDRKGINSLLKSALKAGERNRFTVGTGELNRWLEAVQIRQRAPLVDGASVRLKYISQVATTPPTFKVFCNRLSSIRGGYLRYLEQDFRRVFDLPGIPVRFIFSASKNPYAGLDPQRDETPEARAAYRRSKKRNSKRQAHEGKYR